MTYNKTKEHMLKQGSIKKCPSDFKVIQNLIKRAHIDLKTARRNFKTDTECAYNYAYNAMLHLGLALMFSEKVKPAKTNNAKRRPFGLNYYIGDIKRA